MINTRTVLGIAAAVIVIIGVGRTHDRPAEPTPTKPAATAAATAKPARTAPLQVRSGIAIHSAHGDLEFRAVCEPQTGHASDVHPNTTAARERAARMCADTVRNLRDAGLAGR